MKQPNWKIPFILSGTLLVLGTFTYWLQFSHKPKADKAAALLKKPMPVNEEQIVSFKIKSSNGLIEGKCDSLAQKTCTPAAVGSWTITHPGTHKGDPETIRDTLSNAVNMQATEVIDLSQETPEKQKQLIDEYGLSDQKRTNIKTEFVEVTLENGKKLAAWFGEDHPLGDKIFVGSSENGTLNPQSIFLITSFYKSNIFGKNLTFFRDKTLFGFDRKEVVSFDGKTSKMPISAKLNDGKWTINGFPGDRDHIETFLTAISNAKAKEFVDASILSGAKTLASLKIHTKSVDYSLELYEKKPGKSVESKFYLKSSTRPEIVEVENQLKNQIDVGPGELRQTEILPKADKPIAKFFKVEGKGFNPPAEFTFDGKDWKYTGKGEELDPNNAFVLVERLSGTRSKDIVSPPPTKGSERLTLSIGDESNKTRTHFEIYSVKDKLYGIDLNSKANEAYVLDDKVKNLFTFKRDSWKIKK